MMETIQIDKLKALKAYNESDPDGKKLLELLLGDQLVLNITDRVKSFEEACKVLGIKPEDVLHSAHSEYLKKDIDSVNAYMQLIVITRALNEGWEPDWNNEDEYKYYPWFYFNKPGFRLDSVGCNYFSSNVGSRLCFRSEELAQYAAKQFLDLYKTFMTL
jgi:hypothetical protein